MRSQIGLLDKKKSMSLPPPRLCGFSPEAGLLIRSETSVVVCRQYRKADSCSEKHGEIGETNRGEVAVTWTYPIPGTEGVAAQGAASATSRTHFEGRLLPARF